MEKEAIKKKLTVLSCAASLIVAMLIAGYMVPSIRTELRYIGGLVLQFASAILGLI